MGALIVMLSCWRSMYGQVALEVFDHFTPLITDQEPMFEMLMLELVTRMGLEREYRPPEARVPGARAGVPPILVHE